MIGGTDVNVPGPTPEELALVSEQTLLLREQSTIVREQARVQNLLAPFLFESAGVTPITDSSGQIIGFEGIEEEEDPNQGLIDEIETGFLERTVAALRGELPVNPALVRGAEDAQSLLEERLRKQLGPGFETSSPGIEALARQDQLTQELFEGARRGDLSLAEQLSIQRAGSESAQATDLLNRILGIQGFQGQISSGFGGAAQGLSNPLSFFTGQRELEFQGSLAEAANRASTLGALFGGIGNIAGGIAGNPFGPFGV